MENFGIINYLTYVLGCIMIVLLPGPNSLYVLTLSMQRGHKAGWQAALGIFLGDSILMFCSAAGAVTLLKTYPLLFDMIKYAGALYLSYIGIRLIMAAIKAWPKAKDPLDALEKAQASVQLNKTDSPFIKALVISLLNPKAILFFLSFFVQFVDPNYPNPVISFLILGLTAQVFSAIYLATLIYGGNYLAESFRKRQRLSAASSGATGLVFLTFAAKLATASALN
ncbi:leucine efflux protein LeuE [Thiolinea disciformis]|uniref:leucine efflux protein LeuE n=1 Tax=Thiolinea disciformis TaxID=125614 RepID=UPI0003660BAF|nr:leucine efflux protein LeuE [Thiolinea disciformis]